MYCYGYWICNLPASVYDFFNPCQKVFSHEAQQIYELKHFDLKAVKENLLFNPVAKKAAIHKSQKDLSNQRPLAIYSVIDSAQKDVEEIKNIMIRHFER